MSLRSSAIVDLPVLPVLPVPDNTLQALGDCAHQFLGQKADRRTLYVMRIELENVLHRAGIDGLVVDVVPMVEGEYPISYRTSAAVHFLDRMTGRRLCPEEVNELISESDRRRLTEHSSGTIIPE